MTRRRMIIVYGVWVAALGTVPLPGRAQGLRYAYGSGDTIRFVETMDVNGTSTGRGGTLAIGISRVARLSLAFSATDTVRAWYDSLSMESTGPTGRRRADTHSILRVPFVLRVRADGDVKTLLTPTLPDIVRQLAEFWPQFDDFLPLLPPDSMAVGAARTDTLQRRETLGDRRILTRRIIWSRIERDTLVGVRPSFVVSIRSTLRVEVSSGDGKTEFSASNVLDAIETGVAIVSRTGALLQRTRTGEARGATTYKGRGAEVSVPQSYTYRATIKALEKQDP